MIEIRKMTLQDVEQIAGMEKLCFTDPWSAASIASETDNPLSLWLVACVGDTVVGYIGSQSVMGWADMMNVAVHPDFRRQGIGETLVTALEKELRLSGNTCLSLEVRASNQPAIALYQKLGFVQVGLRRNYYHKPKEDALILRKEWKL